jgi:hypothetical protein
MKEAEVNDGLRTGSGFPIKSSRPWRLFCNMVRHFRACHFREFCLRKGESSILTVQIKKRILLPDLPPNARRSEYEVTRADHPALRNFS